MSEERQSMYVHTFYLSDAWKKICLVQLSGKQTYLNVAKRLAQFKLPMIAMPAHDLGAEFSNIGFETVIPHRRPYKPEINFSSYCDQSVEALMNQGVGFVFTMDANSEYLYGTHRTEQPWYEFVDILEDLLSRQLRDEPVLAAMVNDKDMWTPWRQYFWVDNVKVPGQPKSIPVSSFMGDKAKQYMVDQAYLAAKKGAIVEIGRLTGGSATLLALGSRAGGAPLSVLSFDPFPRPAAARLLSLYGLSKNVNLINMYSEAGAAMWPQKNLPPISFLLIDGDHEYDAVIKDVNAWGPLVRKGGKIIFHDYGSDYDILYKTTRALYDSILQHPELWEDFQNIDCSLVATRKVASAAELSGRDPYKNL